MLTFTFLNILKENALNEPQNYKTKIMFSILTFGRIFLKETLSCVFPALHVTPKIPTPFTELDNLPVHSQMCLADINGRSLTQFITSSPEQGTNHHWIGIVMVLSKIFISIQALSLGTCTIQVQMEQAFGREKAMNNYNYNFSLRRFQGFNVKAGRAVAAARIKSVSTASGPTWT